MRELDSIKDEFVYNTRDNSYLVIKKRPDFTPVKVLEIPTTVFYGDCLELYKRALSRKEELLSLYPASDYERIWLSESLFPDDEQL
ncbi:MAG: hypothetical protein ABIC91_08390 [Nanoarchaeota archaeon]|nr:hypothetical protein [Nanoarchaeota archaeon]MBU1030344.1 hypothetical protein [Nanoarchaeota archaeon]MBU1849804.1 hypothetical protein [Nanoarchaeota archaeon]